MLGGAVGGSGIGGATEEMEGGIEDVIEGTEVAGAAGALTFTLVAVGRAVLRGSFEGSFLMTCGRAEAIVVGICVVWPSRICGSTE